MKTIEEMIKVMEHFKNGGEIEFSSDNNNWHNLEEPQWNWSDYDYRIKEQKKTVTIEKWLLERDGDITAVEGNEDSLTSWNGWKKVKLLNSYEVEI